MKMPGFLSVIIVLIFNTYAFGISGGDTPHAYWGDGSDGAASGAGALECTTSNNQPCVLGQYTTFESSGAITADADCMGLFIFATESIMLSSGGSINMAGRGFTDNVGAGFVNYSSELARIIPTTAVSGTFYTNIQKVKGGSGGMGGYGEGLRNISASNCHDGSGAQNSDNRGSLSGGYPGGTGTFFSGGAGSGGGQGASVLTSAGNTGTDIGEQVTGTSGIYLDSTRGSSVGAPVRTTLLADGTPGAWGNLNKGGGGGAGSLDAGGAIYLIAPSITIASGYTFNTSAGSSGSNGEAGTCTQLYGTQCATQGFSCGGGGGGGAGGGPVVLIYKTLTDNGGTFTTSGSAAGSNGGSTEGSDHSAFTCFQCNLPAAAAGSAGSIYKFDIDDETVTIQ